MVNSRSNSLTLELAGYCAIAAIISAFTAHKLTKAAATKAENARRLEEAKAASLANVERNNAQVEKGLPRGSKDDDLKIDSIYVWELEDLKKRFPSEGEGIENVMNVHLQRAGMGTGRKTMVSMTTTMKKGMALRKGTPYNKIIGEKEVIIADVVRKPDGSTVSKAFIRAGPREKLHFNPDEVNAAIVTCGGLCPGLNNVVRELTNTLVNLYGAGTVYGIRGGYKGFYDPEYSPIQLDPDVVSTIHHEGGTFLGSSRGGFDLERICNFLKAKNISQLYVIGG